MSHMVGEFPELQGHMGRLYALEQGLSEEAALALEEHYLPRFAGDQLPQTDAGLLLALADRLDRLAGCFSMGMAPRGSADPQGLRRAAVGAVALLAHAAESCSLESLLKTAMEGYDSLQTKLSAEESLDSLHAFLLGRFRSSQRDQGRATDVVEAVLAAGGDDLVQLDARIRALDALRDSPDFEDLVQPFKRVLNITRDWSSTLYREALFETTEEQVLAQAFEACSDQISERVAALDFESALKAMAALRPSVNAYFEAVMVMADDEELRHSRLGLLTAVGQLFQQVADFRRLSS